MKTNSWTIRVTNIEERSKSTKEEPPDETELMINPNSKAPRATRLYLTISTTKIANLTYNVRK